MAHTPIPPVEAHVRWDHRAHRPSSIRWNGRQVLVTNLRAIRDERAAYPEGRGPRISFVLDTNDGLRTSLAFDGRRRRWYVEALDPAV